MNSACRITRASKPDGGAGAIYVCGLADLGSAAETFRPSHLISLVPDFEQPPTPDFIAPRNHLRLELDDIEEPTPELLLPDRKHVERLIRFVESWPGDRPLMIHCAAGVSRSTAAALVALACVTDLSEQELASTLRRAAPHAAPNRRIVELADALLEKGGRLVKALDALDKVEKADRGPIACLRVPLSPTRPRFRPRQG